MHQATQQRSAGTGRIVLATLALLVLIGPTFAQFRRDKEITFPPRPNELDPDAIIDEKGKPKKDSRIWALEMKLFFSKVPFRSIKVNVPGRGERLYYFLLYAVSNPTNEPRTFVPNFDLVLQDTFPPKPYGDQILPTVQAAISKELDPKNLLKIKSSVEIFADPIPIQIFAENDPPEKKKALKRWTYGVAIWEGPDPNELEGDRIKRERGARTPSIANSTNFSIFVSGLSNGLAMTDGPEDAKKKITRVKTLQINFRRKGDPELARDEDIEYVSHRWIYRALDSIFNPFAFPGKNP